MIERCFQPYIDTETKERLLFLSSKLNRSISEIVRYALSSYIAEFREKKMSKTRIKVYTSAEFYEMVSWVAFYLQITRSNLVRQALKDYLPKYENLN